MLDILFPSSVELHIAVGKVYFMFPDNLFCRVLEELQVHPITLSK